MHVMPDGGYLQVKMHDQKREISAQHTTYGNADIRDNSKTIYIHAISGDRSDMNKLETVEIKEAVGYSWKLKEGEFGDIQC